MNPNPFCLTLYKSLVRPHLEYCTAASSQHYANDKVLLEKIQHRFTRMIVGMKELPYEERLRRLGLWTLEERRVRADLIEVYGMSKGLSKVKFDYFFKYATDSRTRGHHLKLKKGRVHLDLRQHFFTERVINIWNSLDDQRVSPTSLNSFKSNLSRLRNKSQLQMDPV